MDGLFVPQEWDNLVRGRSGILSDGGGGCKGTGLPCASAQRDRGGRHADGQVPTPSKKRRTAGEGDRTDAKALPKGGVQAAGEPCMHSAARTTDEVCNSIMQGLNRNQMTQGGGQEDGDVEMRLDHVLSRIPYKDMLRDLFDQCKEVDCPQIPVVTRRYEVGCPPGGQHCGGHA